MYTISYTKYLCNIYTSVVVDLCFLHYDILFAVADVRDVARSKVPCLYSITRVMSTSPLYNSLMLPVCKGDVAGTVLM